MTNNVHYEDGIASITAELVEVDVRPRMAASLLRFPMLYKDGFISDIREMVRLDHPRTKVSKIIVGYGYNFLYEHNPNKEQTLHNSHIDYRKELSDYTFDHPYTSGIVHRRIEDRHYLTISLIPPPPPSAFGSYAFNEWMALVKHNIRAVAVRAGNYVEIAAPLSHFQEYLDGLKKEIDFHNEHYSKMTKTQKVCYSFPKVVQSESLEYITISIRRLMKTTEGNE